jgi:multiple sugar transport system permease protein
MNSGSFRWFFAKNCHCKGWIALNKTSGFGKPIKYFFVIFWSFISVVPLVWILSLSFESQTEWNAFPPHLIPAFPTWSNYINAFLNSPVPIFFMNTVIVTLISLTLSLLFGTMAAYVIARKEFPLKKAVFFSIISVRMIPALLSIIPLYVIMFKLGLINTYLSLIMAYMATGIPVVTWIMSGFFETVPKEIEEAALIDGCKPFQIFINVILPLVTPGISVSAIFVFVRIWNEYIMALTLTSTQEMRTLPVGIRIALGTRMADFGSMAAYSMIAIVPIVITFIVFQKKFVSGLTSGAIK